MERGSDTGDQVNPDEELLSQVRCEVPFTLEKGREKETFDARWSCHGCRWREEVASWSLLAQSVGFALPVSRGRSLQWCKESADAVVAHRGCGWSEWVTSRSLSAQRAILRVLEESEMQDFTSLWV